MMNTVQNTAPTANPLRLCLRYILKSANGSLHYISHAKACGDEILKAGGIQFFAQPVYVYGKCVLVHKAIRLPQLLHELFPAHYPAPVFHKGKQYAVFVFLSNAPFRRRIEGSGCRC